VVSPDDQGTLFEPSPAAGDRKAADGRIQPSAATEELLALADRLRARWGDRLRLGTSSWHFPGWAGQVWARSYPEPDLSRHGLAAYARHPLLRCVSLDRAFYRPLDAATYTGLAAQVDEGFRFVVKAPAQLTDAMQREPGSGKALQPNAGFLDPRLALEACLQPAVQGLGERLGALVFQVSPLPARWLDDRPGLRERLDALWQAVVPALPPGSRAALEVRDAELLTPDLAALLRAHGVRYCLGLHDRMPDADMQLPMLRATWPGDFVCRWNLQRGQRYAQARDRWAPFDRLCSPDPVTRAGIARVARATLEAGHRVFVTVNNKAEGSAPASVLELARLLDR
jgi:uncharacterized protein YecE (DUF72 family)